MGFLSGEKVIVGYDLGNEFSQISFSRSDSDDAETVSQVAGTENFNIPTVLCKRTGVNQWFYGKDAIRHSEEQDGILVENLLRLALDGEPVLIEGESIEPTALLTLFFKRSLGLLSQVAATDKIEALMITCEVMDYRILEILNQIVAGIHLKGIKVAFQSHTESYYNYVIRQPRELWVHQAVLFDYCGSRIRSYRMECNRRTTPTVVLVDEKEFPFPERKALTESADGELLKIAEEICEGKQVFSVFLVGDGFEQEWMKESLRYLCRNRRVFQGNNLFSKGACFGMQERLCASETGKEHVFLGNDKLKANIGMKLMRRGEESYYVIFDAGINWYEAEHEMEFYIRDGNEIQLTVTPLNGKNGKYAQIVLEDFPGNIARLRAKFYLERENLLAVELEDLGFGEIRPSSGRSWKEKIELY